MPTKRQTISKEAGIAMIQRAIDKTDWKGLYEAEVKSHSSTRDELARVEERRKELSQRCDDLRNERDRALRTAEASDKMQQLERGSVSEAERREAVQARRADFWKGVAMGIDAKKATRIEARLRAEKMAPGGSFSSALYPR